MNRVQWLISRQCQGCEHLSQSKKWVKVYQGHNGQAISFACALELMPVRIDSMQVFLTGATGFVGKHMVQRLLAEGHAVRALLRVPPGEKARVVQGFRQEGDFRYVQGDVVSGSGLAAAMKGCDAVLHLVGIIVEKAKNTFDAVHHIGTRNVVEAAKRNGIKRFIQMSALGVRKDGVAAYQTSKWKGEEEVRGSGIPYCILRPSVIFGPGDGFVTQMIQTMRQAPLFRPVPGSGKPRYRPIFIDDVTRASCAR